MVQESALNRCPYRIGCWFIKPRGAAVITGIGALLLSVFYMSLLDAKDLLVEEIGMSKRCADVVIHAYAAAGLYLGAASILLLSSALSYNELCPQIWMWYVIVFSGFDTIFVFFIFVTTLLSSPVFATTLLSADVLLWSAVYFWALPLVNGFRNSIHTVVITLG